MIWPAEWLSAASARCQWSAAACRSCITNAGPRTRMCGLFVLAIVLTALLIATPWLPYSPWNKPVARFGLVEEPAPMNSTVVVPRIIHQTWKTADVPKWADHARKECLRLHPGYEYKFWTDASAREMIAKDYPVYLPMYDGYKYGIQRADAMRLFFLHKYGGIYIDLDIECLRSLDFLRHYGWVMPQTKPVGFSNDFMMGTAGHPFLAQMLKGLPKWNKRFGSKYPTVMFSTGPMFVSYQVSWCWRLPLCLRPAPCDRRNISGLDRPEVCHLLGFTSAGLPLSEAGGAVRAAGVFVRQIHALRGDAVQALHGVHVAWLGCRHAEVGVPGAPAAAGLRCGGCCGADGAGGFSRLAGRVGRRQQRCAGQQGALTRTACGCCRHSCRDGS